jgi:WD40 repeat protein
MDCVFPQVVVPIRMNTLMRFLFRRTAVGHIVADRTAFRSVVASARRLLSTGLLAGCAASIWVWNCLPLRAETPTLGTVLNASPQDALGLQPAGPKQQTPVVTTVAISPDGIQLATAGDDHIINLWNIDDGKLVHQLRTHTDWVRAVVYSPDGKLLASGGDDRKIHLWDPSTGKLIRKFGHKGKETSSDEAPTNEQAAIYALQFDPSGKTIAVAGFENVVRLYDVSSGELIRTFDCSCNDIRAVAFSHDGQKLVAGGRDGHIRIWNVSDGSVFKDWQGHDHRIRVVAFSPTGDRIATAGENPTIRIWDLATAQQLTEMDHGQGKVLALCFCGEDRLASGGSDNLVRVWNLSTQQITANYPGHTGSVAALACDPSGKMLVSGSFDTTIRVWQLNPAKAN